MDINVGTHLSFPSFLSPPFLTYFATLPTSFGGKGPHLMTGRTAPSPDGLLAEVLRGFLSRKANARTSVQSPRDHFIFTLSISYRRD